MGGGGRGKPECGGSWVLGPLAPSLASGEGSGYVVGADVAGDSCPHLCPRAVSTGLTVPLLPPTTQSHRGRQWGTLGDRPTGLGVRRDSFLSLNLLRADRGLGTDLAPQSTRVRAPGPAVAPC